MATFDLSTVPWVTFSREDSIGGAWDLADRWLSDLGIEIGAAPDVGAKVDDDTFAFRLEQDGGKVAVCFVQVDYDADFDGERYVDRSKAIHVEVQRGE